MYDSLQIQGGLQLCSDNVDGIGAIAAAELLTPPGVAYSHTFNLVIMGDKV